MVYGALDVKSRKSTVFFGPFGSIISLSLRRRDLCSRIVEKKEYRDIKFCIENWGIIFWLKFMLIVFSTWWLQWWVLSAHHQSFDSVIKMSFIFCVRNVNSVSLYAYKICTMYVLSLGQQPKPKILQWRAPHVLVEGDIFTTASWSSSIIHFIQCMITALISDYKISRKKMPK